MTLFLINPGHQGLTQIDRFYMRKDKQSCKVPPGIYEGEFNRKVARQIKKLVPAEIITDGGISPRESTRVKYGNAIAKRHGGKAIWIDIHANASRSKGWSSASGFTVFHYPHSKQGKKLAQSVFNSLYATAITPRYIKQSKFYVLRATEMPAILVECGFMTNLKDAKYLASNQGVKDIAAAIVDGITSYREGYNWL